MTLAVLRRQDRNDSIAKTRPHCGLRKTSLVLLGLRLEVLSWKGKEQIEEIVHGGVMRKGASERAGRQEGVFVRWTRAT